MKVSINGHKEEVVISNVTVVGGDIIVEGSRSHNKGHDHYARTDVTLTLSLDELGVIEDELVKCFGLGEALQQALSVMA